MDNSISVIVPMYNCVNTIKKMLDSLLAQTHPVSQIILIDDGSSDGTLEVCQLIANNNSCIEIITSQHMGVSHARNIGLDRATGQWVSFVDADDYLDSNFYSLMLSAISKDNSDGAICGYNTVKDGLITPIINESLKILSSSDLLPLMYAQSELEGFIWNRLFKRNSISNISFDETITRCEDMLFQTQLFTSCNIRFSYIPSALYYYVSNNDSTTNNLTFFNEGKFCYAGAFSKIREIYSEPVVTEKYCSIMEYSMYCLLKQWRNGDKTVYGQIKQLKNELRKYSCKSLIAKHPFIYAIIRL